VKLVFASEAKNREAISFAGDTMSSVNLSLSQTTTVALSILALAVAPLLHASPAIAEEAAAAINRIEVNATNLRSSNGTFRCQLFNSPNGFPKDDHAAIAGSVARIKDRHAACVFPNLPPGNYAAVAMHDENDNGKMDYNMLGIPKEGYGFSNDARALLNPPSFDAAKFHYSGGAMSVPLKLHY